MACGLRASHTRTSSAERGCPLVSSRGVVGIDAKDRVAVSARFVGRGPAAEPLVVDMLGRVLHQPLRGHAPPAPGNVEWHQREVFSRPARVPA